jgi:hypothetical protein
LRALARPDEVVTRSPATAHRDAMSSTFLRAFRSALASLALAAGCAAGVARTGGVASTTRAADAPPSPAQDYLVLVASEAVDQIAVARFGPSGIRVERVNTTGILPADVDGPHGVALSPDGTYSYVSTAHGTPYGFLWKYTTASDSLVGRVMLGNFPATLQVTPDGAFIYVVNFNVHGDMVPSSVSIVAADESADDRYAFVSQEWVGSEPGGVNVVDLRSLRRVASVDVGQQAGGIDFWTTAPAR